MVEISSCETCGAILQSLPIEANKTSRGTLSDASHPNIVDSKCQCCGRTIRVFAQNVKQQEFCPDCQKQRRKKNKTFSIDGPLFKQDIKETPSKSKKQVEPKDAVYSVPKVKTFRDAVHGDIDLFEWEVDIVDTPSFQRLRGIKQLGLANYVYPGAVHTRFDHSLGTVFMAQKIIDSLKQKHADFRDENIVYIIRLTALLHDIGHLPYGHTLEDECKILSTRHDQWERLDKYVGVGTDIGSILVGLGYYEDVISALKQLGSKTSGIEAETEKIKSVSPYVSDLVGNTICADLFDYLLRDGYYCGLNLGFDERLIKYFDIDPISKHLIVRLEKGGEFRRDNISELIGLLRSRYSLAEKVLFHHTKLAASAMLARALRLSGMNENNFINLRDEQLIEELFGIGDETIDSIVSALRERKLHKLMFRVSPEYAELRQNRRRLSSILHEDQRYQENLLRDLEEHFGMPYGSLALYCPGEEMHFKAAQVLVVPNGYSNPEHLSNISDPAFAPDVQSLRRKHDGLWTMQLFLAEKQYPKAVNIAGGLKRIIADKYHLVLENDLDVRPSKRWKDVKLRNRVIEEFALDKNLQRTQEQHLQLELEKYAVSFRKADIENPGARYRRACEEWWRQVGGK